MIATLVQDVTRYRTPLLIAGAVTAVVLLAVLGRRIVHRMPPGTPWFYYLASVGGLAVSLNTSWRFFGNRLGVTGAERVVMFSVVELALIACALGMRVNVRRVDPVTGRPGPAGAPRTVAWVLCGLSAYAALLLSGPIEGIARVALGPTLSLVMLHLALGIEIRNHTRVRTGTWARVGIEMRERVLSRLGLADDDRDALTRTRERAARRVAQLALGEQTALRTARLSRALRASYVAHDPVMRERMLAELAVLRHARELATLPLASPWAQAGTPSTPSATVSGPSRVGAEASTTASIVSTTASSASSSVSACGAPVSGASTDGEQPEPVRAEHAEQIHEQGALAEQVREQGALAERVGREQMVLVPAASEDTYANGMLDGVLLAAHTSPEWAAETSKNAAIDLADELLPDRTPRALVAALGQIGMTVAESSVRRRRAQRPDPAEQPEQLGEQEHEHSERREHAERSAG
jgi:hypothetical protein